MLPRTRIQIYESLYKDLPENTIAEKIIKLRYMHNLEKEELAKILDFHIDTIVGWENENVLPKPENINKLCTFFNLPLNYFHEYYDIYFNSPGEHIKKWRIKNDLTYQRAADLVGISYSAFGRLMNGKVSLSYQMYKKFKELGAF